MKYNYDVIVIGGGPAGLAAAIEAKKNDAGNILIIERNEELGGILPQCIHNGFGSVLFKKDYPGPVYAQKFIDEVKELDIEALTDTMVLDITASKKVYAANSKTGYLKLQAKAIVLAMGCRERTRAQINLAGARPAGVFTAGTAQRLVNIEGFMPGREFVILGSGDIGMIMARRLTLEGARVKRVVEIMPYLAGLKRNYVQCIQDFDIELTLSVTVKRIIGKNRVEAVEIVKVDKKLKPVPHTEELIACDTLLLSVGLIPENELSIKAMVKLSPSASGPIIDENMATNIPGIFAAGNVVTIYDLVDHVSEAGFIAGRNAAKYVKGKIKKGENFIEIHPGENVKMVIPHRLNRDELEDKDILLELRAAKPFERKVMVELVNGNKVLKSFSKRYARPSEMITLKVKGNDIIKGISSLTDSIEVRVIDMK